MEQSKVIRDTTTEKITFYPKSKKGTCVPVPSLPLPYHLRLQLPCIRATRLQCKLFWTQTKLLKKAYYRKWYSDYKNNEEQANSFARKLSPNSFYRVSWKHGLSWFRKGFWLDKTEVLLAIYSKKYQFLCNKRCRFIEMWLKPQWSCSNSIHWIEICFCDGVGQFVTPW